ncbi:of very long chain fatty acids protein [Seminavis robusta]|uniref:Elongation of fatty acids protein n=1 Tax=Seminavis robusta TaxID=568900 RepID=A0A9N8HFQ2_9STRA|nr:of very long chain fatty acids protein [Seminavis robusta]|eukprot:Sro536_g162090.1 of very long chain fatty acids protein (336) ;mRNA; r:10103-11211
MANLRTESSPKPELPEPSLLARYTCASILMGIFAIWGKYTFVNEAELQVGEDLHDYKVPLGFTVFYLVSLPLMREMVDRFAIVDMKLLLKESMILYNAAQVALNAWMVYKMVDAVLFRGHPFVGSITAPLEAGASYAVWVHYCDKYLEFIDTYFMVLRGKMDQVSFLHVYHHFTISWAWWIGVWLWPHGDCYFGALLNSLIHVMMYSYYTLSLLRVSCPWKKYLTMAQLTQFTTVVIYSVVSFCSLPEESTWRHVVGLGTQVFEMTSLFVMFMHFYRKSYNKGKKASLPKAPEKLVNIEKTESTSSTGSSESSPRASETSDTGSEQSESDSEQSD